MKDFGRKVMSVVAAFILLFLYTYMHEYTHTRVFASYDVNSTVQYGFPFSYTIPNQTEADALDDTSKQFLKLSQNIVEAVGYPLQLIYVALVSFILFYRFKE